MKEHSTQMSSQDQHKINKQEKMQPTSEVTQTAHPAPELQKDQPPHEEQQASRVQTRREHRALQQDTVETRAEINDVTEIITERAQPQPAAPEYSDNEDVPLQEWESIQRSAKALQHTQLSGTEYPDSDTWVAKGEWSNIDIDSFTARWKLVKPEVSVLHAKFILDAQRMPVKATKQLQQALSINTKTVHLILWIRHHWIAATVNTTNATMQIMDSAPGIATQEDIRSIADFIGDALHTPLTTTYLRVPRQPIHSNECGAHAVINLLLSQQEWLWEREESDKLIQRVSYEELTRLLRLFTDGEIRLDFVLSRILLTLGESQYALITHSRLLHLADAWGTRELTIRWMGATMIHTWTGKLIKRAATHWKINYNEESGTHSLPNQNVIYMTIESKNDQDILQSLATTHGDLLALNWEPPSSTLTVEGDTVTVKELKEMLAGERISPKDQHFQAAYAKSTRQHHQQMYNTIKNAPQTWDHLMCSEGLPKLFSQMKAQRKWMCSTTLGKLTSTQGALKVIPFYFPQSPSVRLATSTHWKTIIKGAQTLANIEEPQQAHPASSTQIDETLSRLSDMKLRAMIEIAWLTAARIGDMKLQTKKNFSVGEEIMVVKFTDGKVAKNGAYSIACPLPSLATREYIRTCTTPLLFPGIETEDVKEELRKSDMRLECRSIRRGRLQELSAGGMTDSSLLHISRHASISMLRRYLDYGVVSGENLRRAHLAAAATIKAMSKERMNVQQNSSKMAAEAGAPPRRTSSASSPPSTTSSAASFQSVPRVSESATTER
jgi:hypothetical protein